MAAGGQLELTVVDQATGEPVACRVHIWNAAGRPRKVPRLPFWHDHFVCPGTVTLKLARGQYEFVIERGPEYVQRRGHFTIQDFSDDAKTVDLRRAVDMAAEGWWSGDLLVARDVDDLELLMRAEDLHVVQLVAAPRRSKASRTDRADHAPVIELPDRRYAQRYGKWIDSPLGKLVCARWQDDAVTSATTEATTILDLLNVDRRPADGWIDLAYPAGDDLPLWLATGRIDAIQVAHSGLGRKKTAAITQPTLPHLGGRDAYSAGRTGEELYYHLLNCGLRLPPTAGSGSGLTNNPLGYNRLYVFAGEDFSADAWWDGLRAGRTVVSNGPLLRPLVAGCRPGHVFVAPAGEELVLDVSLNLATGDPIEYLEIIKNGEVAHAVRLDDWASSGALPAVTFRESGWLLIRAVTTLEDTYRFGMTAPYYVEVGDAPQRISHHSASLFRDWAAARLQEVREQSGESAADYIAAHEEALAYWQGLVDASNAP